MRIRDLGAADTATEAFRRLLWLAAELDDAGLDRIVHDELPQLRVRGVEHASGLVGFVAFDANVDPVVIEYIAVAERAQGRGLGSALLEDVRRTSAPRALVARTDDDAVDFYRRAGFTVTAAEPDPHWPERQRYECVLGG